MKRIPTTVSPEKPIYDPSVLINKVKALVEKQR